MSFFAYLLHCCDGSYYCGHTDNLEARIDQHHAGLIAGYTKHRRPVRLVWSQDFPSRIEAQEAERRIKGWTKAKKAALARGDWQEISRLARNRQAAGRPSTGSGRTGAGVPDTFQSSVRPKLVEGRPSPTATTRTHP